MNGIMSACERERIAQRMNAADWRLQWEILPGVVTPGISPMDPKYILDDFGVPSDLCGKRAVDIGAWDGALAFELAKRGATTIATDIQDPHATAFAVAREILNAPVEYVRGSV